MIWQRSPCGYYLISDCLIYTVSRARVSIKPEVWRYTAHRLSVDGDKRLDTFDTADEAKACCERDKEAR